jgi:outer membrane protein assembly complex protein YaeT
LRIALIGLALVATVAVAYSAPAQTSGAGEEPALFAMSSYQGLTVRDIRFRDISGTDQTRLLNSINLHPGEPLDRDKVRDSIRTLYGTGRFADIQLEAERSGDQFVSLVFVTVPNYFVGNVTVENTPPRPNTNQIVNASKFQIGELFTEEKLARAKTNVQQIMQENGFYRSTLQVEETRHPETQLIDIRLILAPGPQARVGQVDITGDAEFSRGQVQDVAKMHPGDLVTVQRVSNALDRLRKKYEKQSRLLAQVSVASRTYQPSSNTVDYTFNIQPGPKVDIVTEGAGIKKSVLKKNVPVYEENALDDDLLNEGRRNLLAYLQGEGYFDADVGIKKHADAAQNEMRIFYVIDEGDRHKLVKVTITGSMQNNLGFPAQDLLQRMQVQPAGRLFSRGRYSQKLLNEDIRGFENLYRNNGFQQVKITSKVEDNYQGQRDQLAIAIAIDPGPLTTVNTVKFAGNRQVPAADFGPLNVEAGQPFSDSRVGDDRDIILNYYFNHGYPNATFEASAKPSPGDPNRLDVVFTIGEGEQFFADQILVAGLNYTRPLVVNRELQIKPGDPLSQLELLTTQQRLYDLGIFSQVDTAVENPDGDQQHKNVLVNVQEAKRYTFNYGVGLEFQTGTPAVGANQPQGETGVSPRVSFEVTRLNFRGLNHTVTFKAHVGRLQQRGLISYEAPRWFNSENWRFSVTAFYDNTLDVTTFTSQRLEGSLQAQQKIGKASLLDYRFTYRRVKASDVEISPDQIPLLSQPVRVGMPEFSFIRDKRDNPLETTKGNYNTVDAGVASGYFGSESAFSRIFLQNSTYQPFGKNRPSSRKFVFARSTRIGVENTYGNTAILSPGASCPNPLSLSPAPTCSVIPLPERFFSGGGNSHRGFGLNQAGPRDPRTGFPLGGAAIFLNNLELRFPPANLPFFGDNLSFAIFHDAGNVFTDGADMVNSLLHWQQRNRSACRNPLTGLQCNYNYISQAVGVGVRYRTPVGPVRFDFGYNLNPPTFPSCQTAPKGGSTLTAAYCPTDAPYFLPQQVSHFNVFFSIGQTF